MPSVLEQKQRGVCGVIGCTTCKPRRIAHWFCAQCGAGPFKFDKNDPGPYKAMRSAFDRTVQNIVPLPSGAPSFEFVTRRLCSTGCWQRETRNIASDEMALAQQRPDLAPMIESKLAAEQAAMPPEFNDDLGVSGMPGSY